MDRLFKKIFLFLLVFLIPIEHCYNKWCRHFSFRLIPPNLVLPKGFERRIYFYISDLVALLLFFLVLWRTPLKRLILKKPTIFLWILFLSALSSILASPLSHYPIIYIRLFQLLTPIFICVSFAHFFSEESLCHFFFFSLLFTAFFQAIVALVQYTYQAPVGLSLFGEPTVFPRFSIPGGKRWLFDRISETASVFRVSGTFSNPNVLGGFLAFSLLGTYSLFERMTPRWFLSVCLGLQLLALAVTYSRSALFGWLLGTFAWFAFYALRHGKGCWRLPSLRWVSFTLLVTSIFIGILLHDQILQRGGVVNYNVLTEKADQERLFYQTIACKIVKDHPLLGAGFAQLNLTNALYLPPGCPKEQANGFVHNIYLYLAAETGLISLSALLLFFFFVLRAAVQAPLTLQTCSLFAITIAFLFIGCCDFYLIHSQEGKLMLFTSTGLQAARFSRKSSSPPIDPTCELP